MIMQACFSCHSYLVVAGFCRVKNWTTVSISTSPRQSLFQYDQMTVANHWVVLQPYKQTKPDRILWKSMTFTRHVCSAFLCNAIYYLALWRGKTGVGIKQFNTSRLGVPAPPIECIFFLSFPLPVPLSSPWCASFLSRRSMGAGD